MHSKATFFKKSLKKETLVQVFFCEFGRIFKKILFYKTPPGTASSPLFVTEYSKLNIQADHKVSSCFAEVPEKNPDGMMLQG